MDRWTDTIRTLLDGAPTQALPLSSILEELAAAGLPARDRRDWILRRLMELPESFLVLPDFPGPWARWPTTRQARPAHPPGPGPERDPWVLSRRTSSTPMGPGKEAVRRIRDALLALGAGVDDGSHGAVARWIRANLEGDRACREILTWKGGYG